MAHLGEAQSVIELFQLKRTTPHLFEGEALTCLITGEGPFEAATATAALLAQKTFTNVINLGIAGSLSNDFQVGEIHPVRSIYLVIEGKPQFKSFKSFDQGLDCVTSFERILTSDKAMILTGVAALIDREAWGVAMAAKKAAVNFSSYKLISDQAGSLGACEMVKDKAQEWSQKLALFLATKITGDNIKREVSEYPGFYFTFTTRHQFDHLVTMLSIREKKSIAEILNELPFETLRELKLSPKDRARKLLSTLEDKVDPLKARLKSELFKWKAPFEKKGITLNTDQTWETPEVKVSFSIQTDEDLKKVIGELNELSLEVFQNLRSGHLNVE